MPTGLLSAQLFTLSLAILILGIGLIYDSFDFTHFSVTLSFKTLLERSIALGLIVATVEALLAIPTVSDTATKENDPDRKIYADACPSSGSLRWFHKKHPCVYVPVRDFIRATTDKPTWILDCRTLCRSGRSTDKTAPGCCRRGQGRGIRPGGGSAERFADTNDADRVVSRGKCHREPHEPGRNIARAERQRRCRHSDHRIARWLRLPAHHGHRHERQRSHKPGAGVGKEPRHRKDRCLFRNARAGGCLSRHRIEQPPRRWLLLGPRDGHRGKLGSPRGLLSGHRGRPLVRNRWPRWWWYGNPRRWRRRVVLEKAGLRSQQQSLVVRVPGSHHGRFQQLERREEVGMGRLFGPERHGATGSLRCPEGLPRIRLSAARGCAPGGTAPRGGSDRGASLGARSERGWFLDPSVASAETEPHGSKLKIHRIVLEGSQNHAVIFSPQTTLWFQAWAREASSLLYTNHF